MAANTKIQWCDHTFNPWRGCTKVAAGCANCYADAQSKRNPGVLGVWGPNGTRVVAGEAMWREPVRWNREAELAGKRRRVFCASLADVFEDWRGRMLDSDGYTLHAGDVWGTNKPWIGVKEIDIGKSVITMADIRERLFALIDQTPSLDWLLVTKRPENIPAMWPMNYGCPGDRAIWSRPNVWLLTSVATQADADRNILELLKCRNLSPVLGISLEPMIGPVELNLAGIDWVIVGGESGPDARPCRATWIRDVVRQCADAGVACFVKQLGSNAEDGHGCHRKLNLKDPKGGDPAEWPEDMRVREFPRQAKAQEDEQ